MKILGLDYGSTTIGTALTDELLITSQPYETITREKENHLRRSFARIREIIQENDVGLIVVGNPLTIDGNEGERSQLTKEFAVTLENKTGIRTVMQDERLTTVEADEIMQKMGIPAGERKKNIDSIAASIILRDYMNANRIGEITNG